MRENGTEVGSITHSGLSLSYMRRGIPALWSCVCERKKEEEKNINKNPKQTQIHVILLISTTTMDRHITLTYIDNHFFETVYMKPNLISHVLCLVSAML